MKRLHTVVQNLNKNFAKIICLQSQKYHIVDHQTNDLNFQSNERSVTKAEFINEIKELLSITRGWELPGMFNPLIVSNLFFEQAQPWEQLTQQHLRNMWQTTRSFLDLLMSYLADEKTSNALLNHVIENIMNWKLNEMNEKLNELLTLYWMGYFITYNHYFTETIQKMKEKCCKTEIAHRLQTFLNWKKDAMIESVKIKNVKMPDLLSVLAFLTEADMDCYVCSEILNCVKAFYKI